MRSKVRQLFGFTWRATVLHVVTYTVVGGLSYALVAKQYWTGPDALPGLRDPTGPHVQTWIWPAQILRGIVHGCILFPLRDALFRMGRWGGLMIAGLLLVIGSVVGIAGLVESLVYTTTASIELYLVHLPEIVIQTVLFGYLLLCWEKRVMTRHGESTVPASTDTKA